MEFSVFHSLRAKTFYQLWRICCVGFLAMAIHANASYTSAVKYGPPGSWVKPHSFNPSPTSLAESGANDHLLLMEKQINALQNETFLHFDRQILTEDGVQNGSTLKINFNPNYQTVTFHWARIWRGIEHLDRLDTNKIQIVQQEQDLDQYALNGEKSIILVLDDVRAGDIIDYSYSIQGENPVFNGHFDSAIPVQLEQPADRLLARLLWPNQKPLYAKAHGCSVRPAVVMGKEAEEFVWDFNQTPSFILEDSLPMWYDPEEWVQLSDFKTWAEVNQWALGLFQYAPPFSPDLSQKIAEWKKIPGREQQVLAVLRFVQDDVRYFGIEIGNSAEKPTDPSTVFSRRFGDCKDKSLLFVAILRALRIEAYPVLVNSTLGRGIQDWQPSGGAFDHCIAKVVCDGQAYWLDPTINYQRGPLAAHYLPDYGCGLVISSYTTGLSVIPQTTALPQTTTTEYIKLGKVEEPSELKVVTVAQGRDADASRALFATTKRSDIERLYTHVYSEYYPEAKMSSPIVVEDNEQENTFQTTEYYSIDKMWVQQGAARKFECDLYPSTIRAYLEKPVDVDRTEPLAVNFPEHRTLRTEVILPTQWVKGVNTKTISDPAFTFRRKDWCDGNKLILQYEYQSLADSVSPDQVSEYVGRLDEVSKSLGYELTWQ